MQSLQLILSSSAYFAPAWVFASINILMGTWVLYIPYVKRNLGLSDTELGLALFVFALGLMCFLPLVPMISQKIGVGHATKMGIIAFALAFIFPVVAPTYAWLCVSLFILGGFSGITDVAMNALVSEIEKEEDIHIMSATHGFFSLGGVIGGLVGSVFLSYAFAPFWHLCLMSLMVILTNLYLAKYYTNIKEEPAEKEQSSYSLAKIKPLVGLAFIAFVIMSSEGAIEHWSNLYFLEVIKLEAEHWAGTGFIAFSLMMTIGRFLGDAVSKRFGAINTILYACMIAMLGYFFILQKTFILSSLGFGVLGLGLSVIIPELYRIAGKSRKVSASVAISFVTGVGYTGFLLGPVVLGFISDFSSLQYSFLFLLGLVFIAFIIAFFQLRKNSSFQL